MTVQEVQTAGTAPSFQHKTPKVTVEIGGISISLHSREQRFRRLLEDRYAGFLRPDAVGEYQFEVEIARPRAKEADEDVRVSKQGEIWRVERGDFRSRWNCESGEGWLRQAVNPYAVDTLVRIVHSIRLAKEGGFLLHAASAIRNGRAFLFSGVSGSGKTTLSRLAPADVTLLTDEMSYIRKENEGGHKGPGYRAYGTPFAGELGRSGENISAEIAGLFFLEQGALNRAERLETGEAARRLLRNILFLTQEDDLVRRVFHSAFEFLKVVPAYRLTFTKDDRVWGLIQ